MARFRNDTFAGVDVDMVDPNQFSFGEVLEEAVADTCLVEDILTGNNSPPAGSTITHAGGGRGSLLGYPNNVLVPIDSRHAYTTEQASGAPVRGYLFLVARYLPTGETSLSVAFEVAGQNEDYEVKVFENDNGAWSAVDAGVVLDFVDNVGGVARITGLTGGQVYYIAVETNFSGRPARRIGGFRTFHDRLNLDAAGEVSRLASSPFPVPTTTASGATVLDFETIDDVLFDADEPYQAYVVNKLARKQNGLFEYLTGAPCGGNKTHTLEDSGVAAPTRSAFFDHSRSGKANEPLVDVSLWSEPFGAVETDGSGAVTDSFGCPGLCSSSKTTGPVAALYIPDNPAAALTSQLEAHLLVCAPDNSDPSMTVYAETQSFGGVGNTEVSASVVWLTGARFGVVTLTGIEFERDAFNLLVLRFDAGGTLKGDGSDFRIVSGCAYLAGAS